MLRRVRRHLCVLVAGPPAGRVERWRRRWDPAMAAVVPAHVTITHPEEVADEDLLLRRARQIGTVPRFRLRLGEVFTEDGGRGGVFTAVHDLDGGWQQLRRLLLAPPMTPVDFPVHVTIAHPRTSSTGPQCAEALAGQQANAEPVIIREVLFTETTADTFTILRRFALAAAPAANPQPPAPE